MATLTYDPTPADQPEFNAEEQAALELGEKVAQEENTLLAGKFEDPAALEQAYLELQSKLGERQPEAEPEPEPEKTIEEYDKEEQTEARSLSPQEQTKLQNIAGGPAEYKALMQWASDNLELDQISMFNGVIQQGDPDACFFAISTLQNLYKGSSNQEGKMLTGRSARDRKPHFRSQAEVVQAMQDARYDSDPAYRQDVFNALQNSELSY